MNLQRLFLFTMLLLVLVAFGAASVHAGNKVEICHIPPGNPDNFHTIKISEKAFPAHLAHGDLSEPCDAVCATLCDDGDACTIDDTGDCEALGCPITPESVDCIDGNECTDDSCDPNAGCVNDVLVGEFCDDGVICTGPDTCDGLGVCGGDLIADCCLGDEDCSTDPCDGAVCNPDTSRCVETPVECPAPNLCTISECAPDSGVCVDADVSCVEGEVCDVGTGQCVPDLPQACPCFTAADLSTTVMDWSCTAADPGSVFLPLSCTNQDTPFSIGVQLRTICETTPGPGGTFVASTERFVSMGHAPPAFPSCDLVRRDDGVITLFSQELFLTDEQLASCRQLIEQQAVTLGVTCQ